MIEFPGNTSPHDSEAFDRVYAALVTPVPWWRRTYYLWTKTLWGQDLTLSATLTECVIGGSWDSGIFRVHLGFFSFVIGE